MTDSASDGRAHAVCIVVPCYNEELRLSVTKFREFLSAYPHITILFVDDGSRDRTVFVIEKIAREFPNSAFVLRGDRNRGKAEAVRRGILTCLDDLHARIVGFWDADLATPLESIPCFLRVLEETPRIEMVFGARVQLLGRHVHRKAIRHYLGRVFATAVSTMLHLAIYDTQCGAKLFRVGPRTREAFAELFLTKWVFDVEILARYLELFAQDRKKLAEAIYEYPLERWVDVAGSKVRPADFFVAIWEVLKIRARYLSTQTRQ